MNVNGFNKCCGCSACFNICPCNAITMQKDKKGFIRPFVDENKCTNCGLCIRVCDFNKESKSQESKLYLGLKNKDLDERKKSQSGGAFFLIAKDVLQNHGIVYGATLENARDVKHIRINDISNLHRLQKSKYAASNIGVSFKNILDDLDNNHIVLFSGTPCQVAGLLSFLTYKKSKLDNLITMDFICHGTPSNQVWSDYIDYIEQKEDKKVVDAVFRNKKFGWSSHFETIYFNDGSELTSKDFRELFYGNHPLSDSCFVCKYSSLNRYSDITIGDLWGEQSNTKNFKDRDGVSLVIVNTEKGKNAFYKIEEAADIIELNKKEITQPNLQRPSPKPKNYDKFWKCYHKKGIGYAIKKYPHSRTIRFLINNYNRLINKLKRVFSKQ